MRQQGRITRWNDDRGFGFIAPDGGGSPVFVHISAMADRSCRPTDGRRVTYELGRDAQGRPRGVDVAFTGSGLRRAARGASENKAPAFAVLVLAIVLAGVLAGKLPLAAIVLYLAASALAFLAYFKDKHAAKRDLWRTPEKTLLVMGLAGGWPGALLAQRVPRHKSSKRSFQLAFWGTVIVNCVALAWAFTPAGARTLHTLFGVR